MKWRGSKTSVELYASPQEAGPAPTPDDDVTDYGLSRFLVFSNPQDYTAYEQNQYPRLLVRHKTVVYTMPVYLAVSIIRIFGLFGLDERPLATRLLTDVPILLFLAVLAALLASASSLPREAVTVCCCVFWVVFCLFGAPVEDIVSGIPELHERVTFATIMSSIAVMSFSRLPRRNAYIVISVAFAVMLVGYIIAYLLTFGVAHHPFTHTLFLLLHAMWGVMGSFYLELAQRKQYLALKGLSSSRELIQEEREKARLLLHATLPSSVADELFERPDALVAHSFTCTLIFINIGGYKGAGSGLASVRSEVGALNTVIERLDELCESFAIDRIKITGSTYIAVAGLLGKGRRHRERAMNMAVCAMTAVAELSGLTGGHLSLRIGVNSGLVIAGVVGKRRFSYDVWGDAVNLCARLAACAQPQSIVVTTEFKNMGIQYRTGPSRTVPMKGKGNVPVVDVAWADGCIDEVPLLSAASGSRSASHRGFTDLRAMFSKQTARLTSRLRTEVGDIDDEVRDMESSDHALKRRAVTLEYAHPEVEAEFLLFLTANMGRYFWEAVFAFNVQNVLFAGLDPFVVPGHLLPTALIIRVCSIILPVALCSLALAVFKLPRSLFLVSVLAANGGLWGMRIWIGTQLDSWNTQDAPKDASFNYLYAEQVVLILPPFFVLGLRHKDKLILAPLVVAMELVTQLFFGVIFYLFNLFGMVVLVFLAGHLLEKELRKGFLAIRSSEKQQGKEIMERQRARVLLANIIPQRIATTLMNPAGEGLVVERFDDVVVIATDLVGFTAMTVTMDPQVLLSFLSAVFCAFDELSEKKKFYRVKTIGDAYICVGNCPNPTPDYVVKAVALASEMISVLNTVSRDMGLAVQMRVGVDVGGPVMGGVLGARKFCYDVWGDPVDRAQELEQMGVPQRVHISEAVKRKISVKTTTRNLPTGGPTYLVA